MRRFRMILALAVLGMLVAQAVAAFAPARYERPARPAARPSVTGHEVYGGHDPHC